MKNTLQLLWSFEGASAFDAAPQLTAWAVIATGIHLFPFRTEKLSPLAPMVLGEQSPGRVGRRPPSFERPLSGAFRRSAPAAGLPQLDGDADLDGIAAPDADARDRPACQAVAAGSADHRPPKRDGPARPVAGDRHGLRAARPK